MIIVGKHSLETGIFSLKYFTAASQGYVCPVTSHALDCVKQ